MDNTFRLPRRRRLRTSATLQFSHKIRRFFILIVVGAAGFGLVVLVSNSLLVGSSSGAPSQTGSLRSSWITKDSQPFNYLQSARNARHLIMVACHGVTISGHLEDADHDEKDWYMLPYQVGRGLPEAIVAHIKAGIDIAARDPESLLLFSGGETRPNAGPEAEGSSYYRVADAMNLWSNNNNNKSINGGENTVRARTTSEEFARDSFENLLFSICRFHEVTGRYPEKITVVSFTFKQKRFETMHAKALHWPTDKFEYVGIDPSASSGFNLQESTRGELENAVIPYEGDPYGCHSKLLQEKRQERNPYARTPPYELTCPDMTALLRYCGPALISTDQVPW